jgi:hypothetical protein
MRAEQKKSRKNYDNSLAICGKKRNFAASKQKRETI